MEWGDLDRLRAGIVVAPCMGWLSALPVVLALVAVCRVTLLLQATALVAGVSEGRIAERD